jgi:16S rRNA G966 N2-methylase RsmD
MPEARKYDIIFADPPYREGFEEAILTSLSMGELLSGDGILVMESGARQILPEYRGRLHMYKCKTYGDTKISYYVLEP